MQKPDSLFSPDLLRTFLLYHECIILSIYIVFG
nr:MAG TPA: hypothetical protein [Caudoviricetes sp.]